MNTSIERLSSVLADRYRIERELGAGGPHANYDVASDNRFLMVKGTNEANLVAVHGWLAELRERLARGAGR